MGLALGSQKPLRAMLILTALLAQYALGSAQESLLELTPLEKNWIRQNPVIVVANEMDWPPFDYVENSRPEGYSIDIARLAAEKAGLKVEFINGVTWAELLEQFKVGDIDIMPAIYLNKEREKYTLFTKSYYSQPSVLVVNKKNKTIRDVHSLAGLRVAGIRGFSITSAIEDTIPNVEVIAVDSVIEGLKRVSLGEADAFVDSIGTVSYVLEKNYIPNIELIGNVGSDEISNPPLYMGINKNKPILHSIVEKALAAITREEKQKLNAQWIYVHRGLYFAEKELFSDEQLNWLSDHPTIRVGIMNSWPPMDYVDSGGEPRGIGVRYIQAINRRLGNRLEIVPGLWRDNYGAVKAKKLDALLDITPRKDREEYVLFTEPYIEVPHLIFTRKGDDAANTLTDLRGKTVGVEKDFFIVSVLKSKYPEIVAKEYATTSDALDALSKGVVEAYIGNRAVANYLIENELITNIVARGKVNETSSVNAIGVRKDWPILRDILQLALNDIDVAERSAIVKPSRQDNRMEDLRSQLRALLSPKEIAWIQSHQPLRLGVDRAWPPVEWIDNSGQYQGMTSDFVKTIFDMSGIRYLAPDVKSWTEVLEESKSGRLDVVPAIVSTPARRDYMNFSRPYLTFPYVIFTRNDFGLVADIHDLYGKKIGVEQGYSMGEQIEKEHPDLNAIHFENTEDILQALSVGNIDAYVGNLTVAVYLLNKTGLTNIKVSAATEYTVDLAIGVNKEFPELYSIIEKSLGLVSDRHRTEIKQRWLKYDFNVGVDYKYVFSVVGVLAFVILFSFLWLLYVQKQKRELALAKAETERANTKLKELDQLKSMFIASVSHELRTPLNAVIGFSSLMKNSFCGDLNDKYIDYAGRIHRSGLHLLSLITDVIDISKIESGNFDVELSNFDFGEIIEEAVSSLKQMADVKGLTFSVETEGAIWMVTDRRRLYQCVLNFLSNSVKYSERGDIHIDAKIEAGFLLCSVTDKGIGIRDEDMAKLFEPFERLESHIKIQEGGTGLGLYLTNKIAKDLLKGAVGAESRLGEGSRFWIRVPISLIEVNSTEGIVHEDGAGN